MSLKKAAPMTTALDADERQLPRDVPGLIAGLAHADPMVRRWSARDLAHSPDAVPALLERLAVETETSVLDVILTSLTCIGDNAAVTGLIECLRSEDAYLRNAAIKSLQQLPQQVEPYMEAVLHDPDPDMRIFAVNVLESLRHPQVEAWLLEVIAQDPHVNVCATAVDLLGEVGSEAAMVPLQNLRERFAHEPYIQFAADLALQRITAT